MTATWRIRPLAQTKAMPSSSMQSLIARLNALLENDQLDHLEITFQLMAALLCRPEVDKTLPLEEAVSTLRLHELRAIWQGLGETEQNRLLTILQDNHQDLRIGFSECEYRLACTTLHEMFELVKAMFNAGLKIPDLASGWDQAETARSFISDLLRHEHPLKHPQKMTLVRCLCTDNGENIRHWINGILVVKSNAHSPAWAEATALNDLIDALKPQPVETSLFRLETCMIGKAEAGWSPELVQSHIANLQSEKHLDANDRRRYLLNTRIQGDDRTLLAYIVMTGQVGCLYKLADSNSKCNTMTK